VRLARAAVLALAVGAALLPLPPATVERWYSRGLYPRAQAVVTALSNRTPYALFDLLLIAGALWLVWRLIRVVGAVLHGGWFRAIVQFAFSVATFCALLYLGFLAVWGMNYRRVSLKEKLRYDAGQVSSMRARELAETTITNLNRLYDAAHAGSPFPDEAIDESLSKAFGEAERMIGVRRSIARGRPKRSLLDPYFHAAAVDGMTDPYFLESLIASELVPVERPFVVAHEWSHLAGFADESEANFVGWLACVQGSPPLQYSGWLFLFNEIVGTLGKDDQAAVTKALEAGPRDDLRDIALRIERQVRPAVFAVGWRAYDQYLKANRVEAGTASYAQVVQLILGTTFGPNWQPLMGS